jgi:hypothetical protein
MTTFPQLKTKFVLAFVDKTGSWDPKGIKYPKTQFIKYLEYIVFDSGYGFHTAGNEQKYNLRPKNVWRN